MQPVVINGASLNWYALKSGVPQGSLLGPILFLVDTNDMPNVIDHCKLAMFDDDSKCFNIIHNNSDFAGIQKDLQSGTKEMRLFKFHI